MRRVATALIVLLFALPAFAQQKNEFQIFLTNGVISHSSASGTEASASGGMAFDRMVTSRMSAQFAVGFERHRTYSYVVEPGGTFRQVTPLRFRTYPIDLAVRYHFLNDTRWKPYLGLGARYVAAPNVGSEFRYKNHIGPEIVGGTVFQIGRSFGLVLDGKVLVGDHEPYDDPFKTSFGLNWRF